MDIRNHRDDHYWHLSPRTESRLIGLGQAAIAFTPNHMTKASMETKTKPLVSSSEDEITRINSKLELIMHIAAFNLVLTVVIIFMILSKISWQYT